MLTDHIFTLQNETCSRRLIRRTIALKFIRTHDYHHAFFAMQMAITHTRWRNSIIRIRVKTQRRMNGLHLHTFCFGLLTRSKGTDITCVNETLNMC